MTLGKLWSDPPRNIQNSHKIVSYFRLYSHDKCTLFIVQLQFFYFFQVDMNLGIRFFYVKCTGNYNIYLTKLPSAFPVNGTQLPFSSVWQECCYPENHHFPCIWLKTDRDVGFPKVQSSVHPMWYHLKDDCGNLFSKCCETTCFPQKFRPHL